MHAGEFYCILQQSHQYDDRSEEGDDDDNAVLAWLVKRLRYGHEHERHSVRITTGTPPILDQVFRALSHSLKVNAGIIYRSDHVHFLGKHSQVITRESFGITQSSY